MTGMAGSGMAQDARPGGAGLMAALDRNGNGKLEPEEIDLAVASLRKLDRNEDGEITPEEVRGGTEGDRAGRPAGGPGAGPGERRGLPDFSRIDQDGDGKISKDEAPVRMRERFDQMDGNGDGFIDKVEQEELIKRLRARFQDGGARRPGQPARPGAPRDDGDGGGGVEKPKRPAPKE